MRQLQNIKYSFDTPLNQGGVTIRKGPKWSDHHTQVGTLMELRNCEQAHHDGVCLPSCEHQGYGVKLGSWYGQMADLPPALLALEHHERTRDLGTLYERMERAYPGFNDETYITALIYIRIAE